VITAWSPSGTQRSRSSAILWRVLGLGLFIFGLLYTHAASPDAAVSHLASETGVSAPDVRFELAAESAGVASATHGVPMGGTPGGHHEDHGQHHTGEECALGQPPQGPHVGMPCLSPLSSSWHHGMYISAHSRRSAAQSFVASIAHKADSAVLRT
jgi:hypothetical protein